MSKFTPDIFKTPSPYVKDLDNPDPSKLIEAIQEFGNQLKNTNKNLFDYGKLMVGTTRNIYDSAHLLNVYFEFILQTVKHLHPNIDLLQVIAHMDQVEEELTKQLKKQDNKDNELMTPVLLGMLEKLL
jgi:hypothetical protein